MKINADVSGIRTDNLCISCGLCSAVCPGKCIDFQHEKGLNLPLIDRDKCTQCGKCLNVCPGKGFDYDSLGGSYGEDFGLRNSRGFFIARTKNKNLLMNAASGGIATEIISHLLSKNTVMGGGISTYS